MNFTNSLFLGTPGSYTIPSLNIKVEFNDKDHVKEETLDTGIFTSFDVVFKNKIFQVITLSTLNLFVAELGHSMAAKILFNENPSILINTREMESDCLLKTKNFSWKMSVYKAADIIASLGFSCFKILGALVLKKTFLWPAGVVLAVGTFIWITMDLINAASELIEQKNTGLGYIAKNNKLHLLVVGAVVVSQCAFMVLAVAILI